MMFDSKILFNWLGCLLIFMPLGLSQNTDKQCFSQSLKPSYPCCEGDKVVYTDKDGDWGVENGKWCGIGNGHSEDDNTCFAVALGYKCCEKCKVVYTDEVGDWGVEKNKWCGIKDSCSTKPVEVKEPEPVKDNSEFDFTFLKIANKKENMLYSPLSIKYALKMLEEGATGNSLDEINNTVGNSTLTKYENIDKVLSLANALFIRDTYYKNVKTEYIDTLTEKYNAEIKKDEFKDANNVNQWVKEKTFGIIKGILDDQTVQNPASVMFLINALAIDMEWVSNFDDTNTGGRPFYLDDGEEMEATSMYQKVYEDYLSYYIDDDKTVVTMDLKNYGGTQFEFMAIMPNKTLSTFVKNVSKEQIRQIDENLIPATEVEDGVVLHIPKFKFSYSLNLKNDLMDIGVNDAFDVTKANFTEMADIKTPAENLYVSDALHKADIEFSEEGIKAAAVTVIVIASGLSMPKPTYPLIIDINRPFMFIIRDKNTKDVWFTGTVYKPNSWDEDVITYSLYRYPNNY